MLFIFSCDDIENNSWSREEQLEFLYDCVTSEGLRIPPSKITCECYLKTLEKK